MNEELSVAKQDTRLMRSSASVPLPSSSVSLSSMAAMRWASVTLRGGSMRKRLWRGAMYNLRVGEVGDVGVMGVATSP